MNRPHCALLASLVLSSGAFAAPPALTIVQKQEWTAFVEIEARGGASQYYRSAAGGVAPTYRPNYRLDSAEVFFPAIESSATHATDLSDFNFKAETWWENQLVDDHPTITPGPLASGRYLRALLPAALGPYEGEKLRLRIALPMTCWETRYNEANALAVKWPVNPWPADLEDCLKAERLLDSDAKEVRALVDEWTNGRARAAPPARLAKVLCGKVVSLIQPTSNGVAVNSYGQMQGFDVAGASAAARAPRPSSVDRTIPSQLDMTCLLVAVYRAAGLPARMVIALDPVKSDESKIPVFRTWAEFALLDESAPAPANWPAASPWPGRIEWIPVDVARQREFSSRPPPLEQRWQYFGHNEDTDDLLPLAFVFHPPAAALPPLPPPVPGASPPAAGQAVIAHGSVALWGWRPQPAVPPLDQSIRAWGGHRVKRGKP